jgi:benzylsuccinate CoA-transferase BbsF subunit
MAMMQAAGVPAGIVATGEDLHRDPQLKHRGHFVVLDHAEMGPHALEAPPFRFSKTGSGPVRSGPLLGEHNEYVCRELLSLTPDEMADLVAEGVFE